MRGKLRGLRVKVLTERDHPRVCGENALKSTKSTPITGSPPRMRGKHYSDTMQELCTGITPAYAGKTAILEFADCRAQDHPRGCGENE